MRKTTPASQTLFKIVWIPTKSGGKVRGFVFDKEGNNILKPATIDDMIPDTKLYMRDAYDRTKFYETYFHPQVSWESVTELFNTKIYYVER